MPGDDRARGPGGPGPRRRLGRRAGGRSRGRLSARRHLLSRQQQDRRRARAGARLRHRLRGRRFALRDRRARRRRGPPRPHPGRRGTHHARRAAGYPRGRADRSARLQVRLWLERGPGHRSAGPLPRGAPSAAGRHARPHRLADLRPVVLQARDRDPHGDPRGVARRAFLRVPPVQPGRRPGDPLHRPRPALVDRRARRGRRRRGGRRGRAPPHGAAHHPGRARPLDRRQGRGHPLPGRHHQVGARRAHLRRRRRRHVRQHQADALRLALRGHDRQSRRRAGQLRGDRRRQALRVGRRPGARREDRAARAGRRAGHALHRRLRVCHGQQLQRPAAAGGRHGGRRPGPRDHRPRDVG